MDSFFFAAQSSILQTPFAVSGQRISERPVEIAQSRFQVCKASQNGEKGSFELSKAPWSWIKKPLGQRTIWHWETRGREYALGNNANLAHGRSSACLILASGFAGHTMVRPWASSSTALKRLRNPTANCTIIPRLHSPKGVQGIKYTHAAVSSSHLQAFRSRLI